MKLIQKSINKIKIVLKTVKWYVFNRNFLKLQGRLMKLINNFPPLQKHYFTVLIVFIDLAAFKYISFLQSNEGINNLKHINRGRVMIDIE